MTDIEHLDDATLVALTRAGRREAFSPLLSRHFASLMRLCMRLLGAGPEAQDLAQDAALAAFIGLHSLTEPARFGAWLHAIAANQAHMALRKRRTLSLEAMLSVGHTPVLWPIPMPLPEDMSAARELHDAIIAALGELSAANRDVAVGYFLNGYSYAELAELLGVPLSTIKGRLFKSRRQLQHRLAPLLDEERTFSPIEKETRSLHRHFSAQKLNRKKPHMVLSHRKDFPVTSEMTHDDLIAVHVAEIRISPWSDHRVVILRADDGRSMPIWIGNAEADAIALHLSGTVPTRPMTHDLALRLLSPLGASIQRVVINVISNYTFFAAMHLSDSGSKTQIVDARPSDAIALAIRCNAPIFVHRSVFESSAHEQAKSDNQDQAFCVKSIDPARSPADPALFIFLGNLAQLAGFEIDVANDYNWEAQELEVDGKVYTSITLPGEAKQRLLLEPATWDTIQQRIERMTAARREFEELIARP